MNLNNLKIKNLKISIFCMLISIALNLTCMEQKQRFEASENIDDDNLLPIDLLLHGNQDQQLVKQIISDLKDDDYKKINFGGLLIYGAPKTGKFSLAYTISKLSHLRFLTIDAIQLLDEANDHRWIHDKEQEACLSSLNDIEAQLPMIISLHGIDQVFLDADSDGSKKDALNFVLNQLISLKNTREHLTYFIFTSNLAPHKFPKTDKLDDLVQNIIEIDQQFPLNNFFAKI